MGGGKGGRRGGLRGGRRDRPRPIIRRSRRFRRAAGTLPRGLARMHLEPCGGPKSDSRPVPDHFDAAAALVAGAGATTQGGTRPVRKALRILLVEDNSSQPIRFQALQNGGKAAGHKSPRVIPRQHCFLVRKPAETIRGQRLLQAQQLDVVFAAPCPCLRRGDCNTLECTHTPLCEIEDHIGTGVE